MPVEMEGFAGCGKRGPKQETTDVESVRAARQVNTLTMAASARMQRLQPLDSVGPLRGVKGSLRRAAQMRQPALDPASRQTEFSVVSKVKMRGRPQKYDRPY